MLTTEQLNAIKERVEKATAGPWEARKWSCPTNDQFFVRQSGESETKEIATAWQGVRYPRMPEICGEEAKANAIFIAHSRTDISALIAEVERLRKELEFRQKVIEIIARDTQCDDTWDFANRIKSGMQPLTLSYRIGGGVDD